MNQEECICALATPAGGAIGIIRLSGSDAITLTDKIFQSANGKSLEEAKPYTLHYEKVVVETRTFLPKHYLFPIPDEDVRRNPKMVQNLGWTTE